MNMLISLATNFGGWIVGGIGIVGLLWARTLRDRADGKAQVRAEQLADDARAADEAASVRRVVSALPADAVRQQLRERAWRNKR
jgi:hypothetical protein